MLQLLILVLLPANVTASVLHVHSNTVTFSNDVGSAF